MLPEGSSPLKARYTTTGYRKDIKEVDIDVPNKCPKGSKLVDGKCVKSETKPTPTPTPEKKGKGFVFVPLVGEKSIKKPEKTTVSGTTPGKTTTTSYQGKKMSEKAWKALTPEERRRLNAAAGADKSGKITKTTPGSSSSISSNPK